MFGDDAGSNIASRKSSRGLGHKKVLSDRLFPIFALMVSPTFGTPFQGIVNVLSLAVECMQQMAFTVNPHFGFHINVAEEAMVFVYSFHIPLWDSLYAALTHTEYSIWFWISTAPVFLVSIYMVLGCLEVFEQGKSSAVLTKVMIPMVHVVSGPLSIPILHGFSANIFCHEGSLWAFPDRPCWELGTTLYFCVSLLGMGLTIAMMALNACCLFNDDVSTRGMLDRAHGRMDMFVALQKVMLVLLYHLLLGSGWLRSYSCFVLLLNALCFFGYAFLLPYYSLGTNRIMCAIHAVAGYTSLVAVVVDASLIEHDVNTALVISLLPVTALLGYYLGGMRVMHECIERMEHLSKFGEVFLHKCYFPIGLVGHDEYHHKGVTLEHEILECPMDDDGPGSSSQKLQNIEVLVPYIQSIIVETDPEVATRFLLAHADATRSGVGYDRCSNGGGMRDRGHLSAHMVAFAARIFLKATVRSKTPSIVELHFANFVRTFCSDVKLSFAHDQAEFVRNSDVGFSTKFQAFRVHAELKTQLGIHSRTHLFSLTRAKRLHKEALSDMSTFWLKLMDTKQDLMSMAFLTNQITEKRHEGQVEYLKAIQDGSMDPEVLISYASFLECVMLDKRQADIVQQSIAAEGEGWRKSMMGSMKSNSTTTTRRMTLLAMLSSERDSDRRDVITNSNSATLMQKSAAISFVIIVLLAIGILAAGTLAQNFQVDTLRKHYEVGRARSLVQMASLESYFLREKVQAADYTSAKVHQKNLQNLTKQYANAHNKLAFGSEQSLHDSIDEHFNLPNYLLRDCSGTCGLPLGLLGLGLELIGAFTSLSLSDSTTDMELLSHPLNRDFSLVIDNSALAATRAYNDTVALYRDELDERMVWVMTGMALGLVLCIYLLISINIVFNFNFRKIGVSKIVAIHLFSLIPFPTQKQLHIASRERIKEFDRHTREADKGTEVLVADADDNESGASDRDKRSNDEDSPVSKSAALSPGENARLEHRRSLMGSSLQNASKGDILANIRRGSLPNAREEEGNKSGNKPRRLVGILMKKRKKGTRREGEKKRVRFTEPDTGRRSTTTTAKVPRRLVENETDMLMNFDPESFRLLTDEERNEIGSEPGSSLSEGRQREAKAHDTVSRSEVLEDGKEASNRTLPLVVLLILVYSAALFFGLMLLFEENDELEVQGRHVSLLREATKLQAESDTLRFHASGFVQSAGSRARNGHWNSYWEMRRAKEGLDTRVRSQRLLVGDELFDWWEYEKTELHVAHVEMVAFAIVPVGDVDYQDYNENVQNLTWHVPREYPRDALMQSREYGFSTNDEDLALPDAERQELAQQVVTSERHQYDISQVRASLSKVYDDGSRRLQNEAYDARRTLEVYIIGHHCLFGVSVALVLTIMWLSRAKGLLRLLIPFVVMSTVAFGVFQVYTQELKQVNYDEAESVAMHWNTSQVLVSDHLNAVELYCTSGDPRYYLEYWRQSDSGDMERMLDFISAHEYLPEDGLVKVEVMKERLAYIQKIYYICFEIMYSLGGDATLMDARPEHHGLQWRRTADDPKPDWYTDREKDLAASEEARRALMRTLLFEGEDTLLDAVRTVKRHLDDVYSTLLDGEIRKIENRKDKLLAIAIAGMFFVALAMIFVGQISVVAGLVTLNIGGQGVRSDVERVNQALFSSVVLKCRLAFVVVFLLMSAQFTLGVWGCTVGNEMLGNIDLSSRRDWAVARSAIAAEHLYAAYEGGTITKAFHLRLEELVTELQDTDTAFTATSQGNVTSKTHVDRLYTKWLNNIGELSRSTKPGTHDRPASQVHEELRTHMNELIWKIWASSESSMEAMQKKVDDVWLFLVLMSVSVVLMVAGQLEFLFRPIMKQLVNEENGTMILLKMIPPKVREIVPKITAYLETGVIIDEDEDRAHYPADKIVTMFMQKFATAQPGDDAARKGCMEILERSSSGIIVADTRGVVIGVNDAVLDIVKYDREDLMEKNVSKLVPDPLAGLHQKFIESYVATGNARIIGRGRDSLVVDSNDQHVHCFLQISEIRQAGVLYFVAQIDRYSLLKEKITQRKAELQRG